MSKKDYAAYRAQQKKDAENHAAGRTALGTPGYGGGNTWEAAPRVHASGYEPGSFSPDAPDPAADASYGRSANSIGPAAATTGGSNYRCTRGGAGCGAPLSGPADQDDHNAQAHGNSGWNRLGEAAISRPAITNSGSGDHADRWYDGPVHD